MPSRRQFLGMAAAGVLGGPRALAQTTPTPGGHRMTATAAFLGQYLYLPFDVPPGVNRVDVKMTKGNPQAALGLGLFDERGAGYQSAGFRGVYGEERSEAFVAAHEASQSFIPGPIRPGTWTVVVPVFRPASPITVEVGFSFGSELPAFVLGATQGVVRDEPAWYRGDLHCHTPESSDAWSSKSAMSPKQWAAEARRVGLDYLAMTDHNVVSQNFHLADDAGSSGVLLMAGEEMTNWFHGHATVSGIEPGHWLDWRQSPLGAPLPSGGARITEFLRVARDMGGYVSAAHPLAAHLSWQFLAEGAADPAALPEGMEVWTGTFQPDDQAALDTWEDLLRRGVRVVANGGSDLHGTRNAEGLAAGTPTTVVHAERLSKAAVVDALRRGRSFITRTPDGAELYLSATGPAGQRQIVGGTIYGEPGDRAEVEVVVRKGAGMRLTVFTAAGPLPPTTVETDDQTVRATVTIGPGGFVRAELRGESLIVPEAPRASRMDMEAFTNPIFLVVGEPPGGTGPDPTSAPPAPGPALPAPAPAPMLPRTGGPAALAVGGAALAGAMTLTELVWRAATDDGLRGRTITIVGQVTGVDPAVLTRWVEDCCVRDGRAVEVELDGLDGADARVGQWFEVEGQWVAGTGAGFHGRPRLRVRSVRTVTARARFEA